MKTLIFSIAVFFPSIAIAADCNAILSNGMRNIVKTQSASAAVAMKHNRHCGTDFSSATEQTIIDAEVEVFGYGSGNAGFDRKKSERNLKQWCDTNRSLSQQSQSFLTESSLVFGPSVDAWQRCNELKNDGVLIDTIIAPDSKAVTIGIKYTGAASSGVRFYGVNPTNFSCTTRLPDGTVSVNNGVTDQGRDEIETVSDQDGEDIDLTTIGNQSISVHCKRGSAMQVTRATGTYDVLPAAYIAIETADKPYQLFFAEENTPSLPVQAAAELRRTINEEFKRADRGRANIQAEMRAEGPRDAWSLVKTKLKLGVDTCSTGQPMELFDSDGNFNAVSMSCSFGQYLKGFSISSKNGTQKWIPTCCSITTDPLQ